MGQDDVEGYAAIKLKKWLDAPWAATYCMICPPGLYMHAHEMHDFIRLTDSAVGLVLTHIYCSNNDKRLYLPWLGF